MKAKISIALCFLILLGNVGLAKTIHFCMGAQLDARIGFTATEIQCEMLKKPKDCHSTGDAHSQSEEDCCEEHVELVVIDQDIQQSTIDINPSLFFIAALVMYELGLQLQEGAGAEFSDYPPPLLQEDLQILHQTFLI
ncbi:HYC_CC_PP family protein [Algoriphagus namhaensis]